MAKEPSEETWKRFLFLNYKKESGKVAEIVQNWVTLPKTNMEP